METRYGNERRYHSNEVVVHVTRVTQGRGASCHNCGHLQKIMCQLIGTTTVEPLDKIGQKKASILARCPQVFNKCSRGKKDILLERYAHFKSVLREGFHCNNQNYIFYNLDLQKHYYTLSLSAPTVYNPLSCATHTALHAIEDSPVG